MIRASVPHFGAMAEYRHDHEIRIIRASIALDTRILARRPSDGDQVLARRQPRLRHSLRAASAARLPASPSRRSGQTQSGLLLPCKSSVSYLASCHPWQQPKCHPWHGLAFRGSPRGLRPACLRLRLARLIFGPIRGARKLPSDAPVSGGSTALCLSLLAVCPSGRCSPSVARNRPTIRNASGLIRGPSTQTAADCGGDQPRLASHPGSPPRFRPR